VDGVAPGAASDNRFRNTSEIARQSCQVKRSAGNQKSQRSLNQVSLPGDQQLCTLDYSNKQIECSTPISRHILVVEDNVINRQVISRKLEPLSYRISEASNGCEALRALQHRHFDCIFMDLEMPEMDGVSTTKAIRKLEKKA
jgi:PleD family two-component response regulator